MGKLFRKFERSWPGLVYCGLFPSNRRVGMINSRRNKVGEGAFGDNIGNEYTRYLMTETAHMLSISKNLSDLSLHEI